MIPDAEFIEGFETLGPSKLARELGMTERSIYRRRDNLEVSLGRSINAPNRAMARRPIVNHPERHTLSIHDGVVLVGSDAHYWPHYTSTAHRALVMACGMLKPKAVIMNGDVLDGASVSRHSPIAWETRPTLADEVETCKERLDEIQSAAKNADFIWTLGNHDARFESRLATVAPEYAKLHGVHLKDHFPYWHPCWSCWINDSVVVKHRYKGGIHATHNNAVSSGKSVVTGHLHSLKVTPWTDYTGTRFGVDTGTLADAFGPQFTDYMEDNPRNWRSGFAVLTFREGCLMWPEVVHVLDEGLVEFRGKEYEV